MNEKLSHQQVTCQIQACFGDLPSKDLHQYVSPSSLIMFKQSELGPETMGDDQLPFLTENPQVELNKIASFLSLAVCQGIYYNTGLFGPFPVLDSDFNGLVFATKVKDSEFFDPRFDGWNYVVACFFYHSELAPLIHAQWEAKIGDFNIFSVKTQNYPR